MKKILLILAVLLLAVPASAVSIDLTDNADGTGTITYDMTADSPKIRAIALTVATSATVTAVTPGFVGQGAGFGIFPGTIIIAGGVVTNDGTPVAPDTAPGAAGTGIGTSTVILEMGSLYTTGNAPGNNGTLATIEVDANCTVTITAEVTYRGGVVDEAAAAVTPTIATGLTITRPGCWDACQALGNANGDAYVDAMDVTTLVPAFGSGPGMSNWDPCCDFNRDGYVDAMDVMVISANFGIGCP